MVGVDRNTKFAFLGVIFAAALGLTACIEVGDPGPEVPAAPEATTTTAAEATTTTAPEATTTTAAEATTTTAPEATTTTAAEATTIAAAPAAPKVAPKEAPKPANPAPLGGNANAKLQRELVDELNKRRADLNLNPVVFSQSVADSAAACSLKSLQQGGLKHCGHEALYSNSGSAANITATDILDAWWASPLHKKMLTYTGSTTAGGAVVYIDGQNGLVAALEIDY